MAYRFKAHEKAVGVIGTLAIVAVIFLVLLKIGVFKNEDLMRTYYTSIFDRGDYFQTPKKITYNGFDIGFTTKCSLMPDDRVLVHFYIKNDYAARVKTNSVVKLNTSLIPGGESVALIPGSSNAAVAPKNSRIYSSDDPEGMRFILLSERNSKLPPNPLDQIVVTLNDMVQTLADKDGPITGILVSLNDLVYTLNNPDGDVKSILKQVDNLLTDFNNTNSVIYEVTHTTKLTDELFETLNSLETTLKSLDVVLKNLDNVKLLGGGSAKKETEKTSTTTTTKPADKASPAKGTEKK